MDGGEDVESVGEFGYRTRDTEGEDVWEGFWGERVCRKVMDFGSWEES